MLPSVNFSDMELSRVVNTLSVISEEFDQTDTTPKGVNIVLLDQSTANPAVNITLRNLPLKRVLDFITDSVGYQYEVQADAIVVRPGGEQSALETHFFPVSRSAVLRMSGKGATRNATTGSDPLAGGTAGNLAASVEGEGQAIRNFLQLAGVSFEGVPGSTLAFDGSQLIATQTPRNLERIRNILNRYNEVRQVEIEAKFIEVQQGALEELGVQWNIAKKATQHSGAAVTNYTTNNRSINGAFSFWQEYRAERAISALQRLLPHRVKALRERTVFELPAEALVPGDVILVAEGDDVPADCRVIQAFGARVNNATVTGESLPKARDERPSPEAVAAMAAFFFVLDRGGWEYGRSLAADPSISRPPRPV